MFTSTLICLEAGVSETHRTAAKQGCFAKLISRPQLICRLVGLWTAFQMQSVRFCLLPILFIVFIFIDPFIFFFLPPYFSPPPSPPRPHPLSLRYLSFLLVIVILFSKQTLFFFFFLSSKRWIDFSVSYLLLVSISAWSFSSAVTDPSLCYRFCLQLIVRLCTNTAPTPVSHHRSRVW